MGLTLVLRIGWAVRASRSSSWTFESAYFMNGLLTPYMLYETTRRGGTVDPAEGEGDKEEAHPCMSVVTAFVGVAV